ncbi:MAG: hypothetical protein IIV03_00770, partial [Clostridia bacterium]|nr:hypothetical protein [Clostridia bacterium]
NTSDTDEGYVIEFSIPRKYFASTELGVFIKLYNTDGTAAYSWDGFNALKENEPSGWLVVRLSDEKAMTDRLAETEPVITEAPVTTTVPVTTEAPVTTTVPVTTEVPVTTTVPVTTEAPVTTTMPVTTEAPATTAEPVTTEATGTTEVTVTTAPPAQDTTQQAPQPSVKEGLGILPTALICAGIIAVAAVIIIVVTKKEKK